MKPSSRIFVSLLLLGAMLCTPALAADRQDVYKRQSQDCAKIHHQEGHHHG